MKQTCIIIGWFLVVAMVSALIGTLLFAIELERSASGREEAEENLGILVAHVRASYEQNGKKLCGSSLVIDDHPFGFSARLASAQSERYRQQVAAEVGENRGFHCLGVTADTLSDGKDGYTYELYESQSQAGSSRHQAFVLRAFRSYLYDPDGTLPRYERRGEVKNGKLVIDSKLYRVAPGGRSFNGHPSDSLPDS